MTTSRTSSRTITRNTPGRRNELFPSIDPRVVYGLVREPRVFVIGPASTGIIKTLRTITPVQNIQAVEINPGVLRMMREDYFRESGEAYRDLPVILGNALSVLRRDARKYDLITLVNAHSTRWIGVVGSPDYLHTREAYDLYLDRLTEDGYLLFEERPDTLRGELGVKRMLLTLYDCLRRRGVKDPAEHFFVWEFMSRRHLEQGRTDIVPGSDMYYVGVVVSLEAVCRATARRPAGLVQSGLVCRLGRRKATGLHPVSATHEAGIS